MRRSIVQAVFNKELMELLRNRRSLMVMFGVPLLLYPMLTIAVASLSQSKQDEMANHPANVAVINAQSTPRLIKLLNDPENKTVAWARRAEASKGLGGADVLITAPENYETDAIAGKNVKLTEEYDSSRQVTTFVRQKVDKVIEAYQQWIIQQRLAAHGLPADLAQVIKPANKDVATGTQAFGAFLSYILPLLLLLTGMLGALYPALGATTTERELGTLETLLVTPATRGELLTAKAGIVLLSGLATALLNMISMSLVFWRVMSQMGKSGVGFQIDPWALCLSYIAAVPTLIFFTALVLLAGLLARNLREANAYATPLMMVPISSMLVGIADPDTTPGLLVTPVANTTLIIRGILTGHASLGEFALAFCSSGLYAGLVLSLAGRLFTNEQLVNPAWEPLSFKGFTRRNKQKKTRWPAVDEALCLFALSLLLNFYLAPSWTKHGVLPLLFGVEVLLIAGPAALFAWMGNYPWREVFSLRRPSVLAVVGALLLGAGLSPVIHALSELQEYFHIPPQKQSDLDQLKELFAGPLAAHPILTCAAVGLLAGMCEEFLFRGPIQAALIKRLPVWMALGTGGLLFAAAHLDLSGLPARWLLGILLGWIVWKTHSIFPAMIVHATYDAVTLHGDAPVLTGAVSPESVGAVPWGWVAAGVVASVAGWMLLRIRTSANGQNNLTASNSMASR